MDNTGDSSVRRLFATVNLINKQIKKSHSVKKSEIFYCELKFEIHF